MAIISLPIIPRPVEYRPVPGFPGYRVGDDGSVWSCWRLKGCGIGRGGKYVMGDSWHQLAGGTDKDGYRKTILCANGRRRYVRIHMLVLEVFVGPRPAGMNSAHENGINTDNRLTNLRWDTQHNNIADKRRHGTHQAGEKHPQSKFTEDQVRQIRRRWAAGESLTALAREFRVPVCTIEAICKRRNWKHVSD